MSKLSQDEIKWILSIDAKGVNKELAVTSSEINKLTADNKRMNSEMKAAEKQMAQQERELQKLTKAGKENTDEYREAKASMEAARAEMDSYITKIGENKKAIETQEATLEKLTKTMDVNEMSMKQLRTRARDLQNQLSITSLAADPAAYKSLQKELSGVYSRMGEVRNSGQSMIQQFAAAPGPVGLATKSVQGLSVAFKALIANPVGIVIMAVAAAFMAIKSAISGSEEATAKLHQVMAPFRVLMDQVLKVVQTLVKGFLDLTLAFIDWSSKMAEKMPLLGNWHKKLNKDIKEGVELEAKKLELQKRERASLVANAEKENQIAKLRNEARQTEKYTNDEIIAKLEEAVSLERSIAEEKIEQAKIKLNLLELENRHADNVAETNEQIAAQTALVIQLETEFYNSTRRLESELNTRRKELRSEDEVAAKAALDKKISDVDFALKRETALFKQQLLDRQISETEYNQMVERASLDALNRKLEFAGLEREQRIEIEEQILEYKLQALKQEEEFQKNRADIIEEWRVRSLGIEEQELASIDAKYDREIEQLKDALNRQLLTKVEFLELEAQAIAEKEAELAEKRKEQDAAQVTKDLQELQVQQDLEAMALQQAYNSGLISKQEYEDALLQLEIRYNELSLNLDNITAEQRRQLQQESLDFATQMMEQETAKQEAEQKKRSQLYNQFSQQIGTMLGGVIAGNEDLVKSSLKTIINMALDALEAQITMSIASATAQSFAQADSVATFGASGAARAGILTALIKGAFAGVKAIVNSALSSNKSKSTVSKSSGTGSLSGSRSIIGRQSGGFMDVSRSQDGKKYRALFDPAYRGFVDQPTVLVGDGPAGRSREWVASNDALQNPTIAPIIEMLNDAQMAGTIRTIDLNHLMRTRLAGFEGGGYVSARPSVPGGSVSQGGQSDVSLSVISDTRDLLQYLKDNGVKAPIVLSDLQRKQALLETSQKIGSK